MLLIGTDEGIYRWTEGNNWPVFHGLQDRVVIGLASPGAGFVAALDNVGRVWETGDNGQSWRGVPLPEGLGRASRIAVGGTPASILLAGGGLGVYRRMMGSTLRRGSPLDLARRAGPAILTRARSLVNRGGTATAATAPRRADDLRGWTRVGAPKVEPSPVAPGIDALTVGPGPWFVAVGGQSLYRSEDAGVSWSKVVGLPADVHGVVPVAGEPARLYAATADGVWASEDAGVTWEERSKGLEAVRHVRVIESCPDEPGFLLAGAAPAASASPRAAARDGLGYGLYESKDAGKSWSRVLRNFPENPHDDAIADIKFDPAEPSHAAVAFESGEMWVTLNGGDYWQPFARDIRSARVLCGIA